MVFHKKNTILSNNCYINLPFFLFHCISHVAANFMFTSKISVILLSLKGFPLNATRKLLVKFEEHKLEEAIFDSIQRDVPLGHFFLLSVPISQQLPRRTSLYFFVFLECRLKLDCTFR